MRPIFLVASFALFQACSLNDYTFKPLVYDLTASPAQVEFGQTSTLSWKLGGRVTDLTLNGESVIGLTSKGVSPLRRQTFTLAASNSLVPSMAAQITVAARGLDLVAGNVAGRGNVNGIGTAARFASPIGTAVVGTTIYVADSGNHQIRTIAPNGQVSAFAGSISGSDDGAVSAARFSAPSDLTVDPLGNFYVADTGNHTIRKIALQGSIWVVSTFVGSPGLSGSADGTGSAARFNFPTGVAADGSGNLYVADWGNHTIRTVTLFGSVTTFAGLAGTPGSADGSGSTARFNFPRGVAVDLSGHVLVADTDNHTIRAINPGSGMVSTMAGSPGAPGSTDGIGAAARFNAPVGAAVDASGIVYIADSGNQAIRTMTTPGVVSTLAGLPGSPGIDDGTGAAARFNSPSGVAVGNASNIFVADTGNQTIRAVTFTSVVTTIAGSAAIVGNTDGTGAAARFSSPSGLATDGLGNIYLADTDNHAIRKVTSGGVVSTFAGSPGVPGSNDGAAATARFSSPGSVALDAFGNLYVADTGNHTIRKVTSTGMVSTLAGFPGLFGSSDGTGAAARFYFPNSIAVDGSGNVYVADLANHTIRQVAPGGTVTTLAGLANTPGSADGIGAAARFNTPAGVAVDGFGNIYVADLGNENIRKITSGAVVSTVAGSAGINGSSDGTGAAARFNSPTNLVVDGSGNLYVTDQENHTVRKVTSTGGVTTIAGTTGLGTVVPSPLPSTMSFPKGIALTPAGDLVVTTSNGTVQITAF